MANDEFWAGRFGDEYTERNRIDPGLRAPFFTKILKLAPDVSSVCEIGANRGHNLRALRGVDSNMRLTGVEINACACAELK